MHLNRSLLLLLVSVAITPALARPHDRRQVKTLPVPVVNPAFPAPPVAEASSSSVPVVAPATSSSSLSVAASSASSSRSTVSSVSSTSTILSSTTTSAPPSSTIVKTVIDGVTVTEITVPSTSSAAPAAASSSAPASGSASTSDGKSTAIGLGVAGGIAFLGLAGFLVWKFTRKRFSDEDDFDDSGAIHWPSAGRDELAGNKPPSTEYLNPSNRTSDGGYGGASPAISSTTDLLPDVYAVPALPQFNPSQAPRMMTPGPGGEPGPYYDPYGGPAPHALEAIPMTQLDPRSRSPAPYRTASPAGYARGPSPGPEMAYGGGRMSPGPELAYGRASPAPGGRMSPGQEQAYRRASPGPEQAYRTGRTSPGPEVAYGPRY